MSTFLAGDLVKCADGEVYEVVSVEASGTLELRHVNHRHVRFSHVDCVALVSTEVGDVFTRSMFSEGLSSEGVNKSGFLDAFSDGHFHQKVSEPDHEAGDQATCDKEKRDLCLVSGGQCDFHSSSFVSPHDAKRFCPPPPVNAEGQRDGSPKAGEGVGTRNETAFRSIADFLSLQYLRQEMRKRAERSASSPIGFGVHVRTDSPV